MISFKRLKPEAFPALAFGAALIVLFGTLTANASSLEWQRPKPVSDRPYLQPQPLYDVRVEHSHMVEMKDGIHLSTDIYFPVGASGPLPTVYIATPYGKHELNTPTYLGKMFAEQGYIVVMQDMRGKLESEGQFIVEHNIAPDLNDTVNWIAKQKWSDGNVGMFGCSFLGQVQYYVAQKRNPHLKAFIVDAGGAGGGHVRWGGMNGSRFGGALLLSDILRWMRERMTTVSLRPSQKLEREDLYRLSKGANFLVIKQPKIDYRELYWHLPIKTMMEKSKATPNDWVDYTGKPPADQYFEQMDLTGPKDRISTPTLHMNSWFDFSVTGTLYFADLFEKIAINKNVKDHQYRLMTPSRHCRAEKLSKDDSIGDLELGDPRFDYQSFYLKWFDRWLRGNKTALEGLTANTYYTTGANKWQTSDVWPPENIVRTPFFLSSKGEETTHSSNGTLTTSISNTRPRKDMYVYDPMKPVMSSQEVISLASVPDTHLQAAREARKDVLVYTSDALDKPLEVTGRIGLELYISSSAADTDFTAWLVDVGPDGKPYNLQTGILRVRYRDGWDKEVMMEPGQIYKIFIDLNAISHVFMPGHKVQLAVSSSNFPKFDRNLNTGGDNFTETEGVIATNAVHYGANYPSKLILPIAN
ncbi:MAG: CocE/NonD family hydrolase [Pseudomonadota bacterium]